MIFLDMPDLSTTVSLSAIIAISGLILTWQKISANSRKVRAEEAARILQAAKEEDALQKSKLEAMIERVDADVKILELSVNKDIIHLRETYNSEIRNLGIKIEELRSEIQSTHGQLVRLLTTLIENKKS